MVSCRFLFAEGRSTSGATATSTPDLTTILICALVSAASLQINCVAPSRAAEPSASGVAVPVAAELAECQYTYSPAEMG